MDSFLGSLLGGAIINEQNGPTVNCMADCSVDQLVPCCAVARVTRLKITADLITEAIVLALVEVCEKEEDPVTSKQ